MPALRHDPHEPIGQCECCGENIYSHAQQEVAERWEDRLDGFCLACAHNRCDAYPGTCERVVQNGEDEETPQADSEL